MMETKKTVVRLVSAVVFVAFCAAAQAGSIEALKNKNSTGKTFSNGFAKVVFGNKKEEKSRGKKERWPRGVPKIKGSGPKKMMEKSGKELASLCPSCCARMEEQAKEDRAQDSADSKNRGADPSRNKKKESADPKNGEEKQAPENPEQKWCDAVEEPAESEGENQKKDRPQDSRKKGRR